MGRWRRGLWEAGKGFGEAEESFLGRVEEMFWEGVLYIWNLLIDWGGK